jgi:antitoxin HicB
MIYPAVLTRDVLGWKLHFPDVPEALTGGATRQEAIELAADALATAMDFYIAESRPVPVPSMVRDGQVAIKLPPPVVQKILQA